MKVKIGTQIEEELFQTLKVHAAKERRAMADVIQAALERYLKDNPKHLAQSDSLLRILDNPARVSDQQFAEIMVADYYEQ